MKKFVITLQLMCLAVAAVLIIRGIKSNIHDRKAAEIRADFEEKIGEFEDTVDDDLKDVLCDVSHDIWDAETIGRVEVFPAHGKSGGSWYEFNTYIDVRVYVKKDMSLMDPYQIRDYLESMEDKIQDISFYYQRTDFPLIYYRTEEGKDLLGEYVYNVNYIPCPVMTKVYVIDTNGDEYRCAGHYAYYLNGKCVEKPFLYGDSSSDSTGSSGSGHSSSSGGYSSHDYAWDVDDYDDPDEYADDAWGEDFDDWDDAYDYWEDNY